uniref:GAG-pre-integrase domain-containing protein n=1 Tax=Tanacetum cinerariifolium TaxID=118510 RepID=A0A699JHG2_TANCI|nr:hypothetical protein [Tanacetum cinerariifolium]
MHEALKATQKRITELESENSNLKNKIQNDDHDIVEEARVEKPLDCLLASACRYTKHSQELVEYVIGTCPTNFNKGDKKIASTPVTRKKRVTFMDQCETSTNYTLAHVKQQTLNKTNEPVILSTGVKGATAASGSKPMSNTKKDTTLPIKSDMNKVEVHARNNKSTVKQKNRVDSSISYKRTSVMKSPVHKFWKIKRVKQVWQATQKLFVTIGFLKHMTKDQSQLKNVLKKFIGTVRLGNDHFGAIMGYGDYVIGDSVISKHSCYVRDSDGVELIKDSRGSNLYTILVEDMLKSSPICLLSKASKNKSWLWHRRLNHLKFGTINDLDRKDLVRGLPRLEFVKDHLCSACQLGKSKKHTYKPKAKNTNLKVLNTLHMDLCGPMPVQTINGKKYKLVIVDDYSRFTWVKFLRSKDETSEFIIKFLKQIPVGLNKTVRFIRTDNVSRTPQQNGIVERWNGTLVEAVRTMLIFSKAPMFLWEEVVATACYTQN